MKGRLAPEREEMGRAREASSPAHRTSRLRGEERERKGGKVSFWSSPEKHPPVHTSFRGVIPLHPQNRSFGRRLKLLVLVHDLIDTLNKGFDGCWTLRAVVRRSFCHPWGVTALPDGNEVGEEALVHVEDGVNEVGRRNVEVVAEMDPTIKEKDGRELLGSWREGRGVGEDVVQRGPASERENEKARERREGEDERKRTKEKKVSFPLSFQQNGNHH